MEHFIQGASPLHRARGPWNRFRLGQHLFKGQVSLKIENELTNIQWSSDTLHICPFCTPRAPSSWKQKEFNLATNSQGYILGKTRQGQNV